MDGRAFVTKLRKTPHIVLDAARHGSIRELTELANYWQEVPELQGMGVLEVFYAHLDATKVPDAPITGVLVETSLASNRAYMALLGLTHLREFANNKSGREAAERLVKSWPGIFKWANYFFAIRVKPTMQMPEIRRSAMDVLAGMLYSICKADIVRPAVLATPGSIELATWMWLFEDNVSTPPIIDLPICTLALDAILYMADADQLNRAMSVSKNKPDAIVKHTMKRIKTEMPKADIDYTRAVIFTDMLCKFCRPPYHPLRHAFLAQGAVGAVTRGLVACVAQKAPSRTNHLDAIVGCFGFLRNCLESSDGFTWVSEAVKAGLLLAVVNASPHYSTLEPEDRGMVLSIIEGIVPRYLVYRTVINDVHAALAIAQASPHIASVSRSPAKSAWEAFVRVAEDRKTVERRSLELKGKQTVCDNAKCVKVAPKEQFRQCSACGTTMYCSKECQTIAWKEGDHKTMCQLKQRENLEGKRHNISKTDKTFIHNLSIRDAWQHFALIKKKAAETCPGVPVDALLVQINYGTHPETYSVAPLAGYKASRTGGTANDGARNEALFDKVRAEPGSYTLIETVIANGEYGQLLMTVAPHLWGLPADAALDFMGAKIAVDFPPPDGENRKLGLKSQKIADVVQASQVF